MKTEGKPSVSMAQVLLHRLQSLAMKQNTLYSFKNCHTASLYAKVYEY